MLYQNIIETIGSTPLVKINHLDPESAEIFVKLESLNDVKAARNLELLNNFTEKVEEMKSAGISKEELENKINSIYEGENRHE